jgi:hypothetical protein
MLLRRENPLLKRDQLDYLYDSSRSWATKSAVLKLYRATPAASLATPAAALRSLDRPALVIWGTKDAYLPVEQAERQRRMFPSAQVEMLDGHGHWVMLEDPERVASLVVPFLRRQLSNLAAGDLKATRIGDVIIVSCCPPGYSQFFYALVQSLIFTGALSSPYVSPGN